MKDEECSIVKVKNLFATENTEFADPVPAFGAGGKISKFSVYSVA